jgi:hypothetical protein
MIGKVIHARLTGSTSAATRIYPQVLPQSPTYPAVTYQQISATREHAQGVDAQIQIVRVQVDSWGSTYSQARQLSSEVTARLSRFKGTAGGILVHDILAENEADLFEPETKTYRVSQDYIAFLHSA